METRPGTWSHICLFAALALILAACGQVVPRVQTPAVPAPAEWSVFDNYTVLFEAIAIPLAIFLFYQSFLNFPSELEEAARVDGASAFRTFVTIMAPLATPAFATVAILSFLEIWSSFMWPLMITRDVEYRPAILGLFAVFGDQIFWNTGWGQIMAYATLLSISVLIVFVGFQRWFVQSVARTGIIG